MKFSDIRWFYFRLRAMSTGEVFHRFREQAKRTYDSRRAFHFDSSTIALPIIPGLLERVRACSDIARSQFRAVADEIRGGRYHFLGQDWPKMDGLPDWHLDPISGKRWREDVFCYSVPFRHNRDYGDVKYVWELNRLQYLQFVAAAAACDDDPDLAKLCVSQIRSWIDANPPFKGVNWCSGIELALRIVSFIVVFSLLPQSSFSGEDRSAISASLRAHLFWLERYPSRYSSANNHLIAEATAQFILGLLASECLGARDAVEYGRNVLNRQGCLQILTDGVPGEQSPTYGAFAAELLLTAQAIALAAGVKGLAPPVLERINLFANFVAWITDRSGNVPRIGDDDEGRVIAGSGSSNDYLNSIVQATLGTATNTDLRCAMLSTASPTNFLPAVDRIGVRTFSQGGYTVIREFAGDKEVLLVFDHGPLGYLGIAAHGHSDALAIWLHVDGEPVLIDGGTYLYHSGGVWREYFRGTAAHSTMRLKGSDQSIQSGAFNWASKARARIVSLVPRLDAFRIEAQHDGYLERFGVIHRRSIERKSPGSYLIEDTLLSNTPQTGAEVGFMVSGQLKVNESANGWMISGVGGTRVTIESPALTGRSHERALTEPQILGWTSTAFGTKAPASRLVLLPPTGLRTISTAIVVHSDGA